MAFIERFFPRMYADSTRDVPYGELRAAGVEALLFDIDNTLAPHDTPLPPPEVLRLLAGLKADGFGICLLSNGSVARVAAFNAGLTLPAVPRARKPLLSGVKKAMALLGARPGNTALIGDQAFTDVWCGNRLGLFTVLVKPVSGRDELSVRLKRGVEKIVIDQYLRRLSGHE